MKVSPWSGMVLAGATSATLLGCGGSDTTHRPLTIEPFSNRADLVSGGEVLLELKLPPDAWVTGIKVRPVSQLKLRATAARPDDACRATRQASLSS